MPKKYSDIIGAIFTFLYCLTTSFSLVIVSHYEQNFSPIKLIFYNFFFTTLFFTPFIITHIKQIKQLIANNKHLVFQANIATAISWISAFFSLKYIEPTIVVAVVFGLQPSVTLLLMLKNKELGIIKKQDYYFGLLITLLVIAVIVYHIFNLNFHLSTQEFYSYLGALLLAVLGGISTTYITFCTKKMYSKGFSSVQTIALRFYLLLIIASFLFYNSNLSLRITELEFTEILAISIISVMLPIYFIQKSVQYTNPLNISLITPLLPALTYILQLIYLKISLTKPMLFLIFLLSGTIFISAIVKNWCNLPKIKFRDR